MILKNIFVLLNDIKNNNFYVNNYIYNDQFKELYNARQQIKQTLIVNIIVQKLISASKKLIK